MPIGLAIIGLGKIARDQHLPAVADNAQFELVGVADPVGGLEDVPSFPSMEALLAELGDQVQAVSLCTPPQGRHALAAQALAAGKHVMVEKPPAVTPSEIDALVRRAGDRTLYTAWHSRMAPAVAPARAWLEHKVLRGGAIRWREDVRRWHPGQRWIWTPGGLGVFDPGINALSILTALVPEPIFVAQAQLSVPRNCQTPIRAELAMQTEGGVEISCQLDWDPPAGSSCWDIELDTVEGKLLISKGGAELFIEGVQQPLAAEREYAELYRQFATLIDAGRSLVDSRPLWLVADAFLLAARHPAEAFYD